MDFAYTTTECNISTASYRTTLQAISHFGSFLQKPHFSTALATEAEHLPRSISPPGCLAIEFPILRNMNQAAYGGDHFYLLHNIPTSPASNRYVLHRAIRNMQLTSRHYSMTPAVCRLFSSNIQQTDGRSASDLISSYLSRSSLRPSILSYPPSLVVRSLTERSLLHCAEPPASLVMCFSSWGSV